MNDLTLIQFHPNSDFTDFKMPWSFDRTQNFVIVHTTLDETREWLIQENFTEEDYVLWSTADDNA